MLHRSSSFSPLSARHSALGRLAPRLLSLVHLLVVFSVIVLGVLAVACGPVGDSSRRPPLLPMQPQSPLPSAVAPTPDPTDAAICARYPTPPYPISLTPCPEYLTPPAEPIEIFTPAPRPTPIVPIVMVGPQMSTARGNTFRPVFISKDYTGSGELCDMRPSPDGQKVALHLCNTEGMSLVIIAPVSGGRAVGEARGGWFRGWFPDSNQWLLMGDHLEVLNSDTGEARRITSEGETVTDAAVSPDGKAVAYTIIQGDRLKIIDTAGNLLHEGLAPSPRPGTTPDLVTWSPDGQFIAYIWDQIVGQFNNYGPLWVLDVQTGKQWQLSPDEVFDSFPTWAPQGHRILVVRRENMDDESADFNLNKLVSNLWVVDADTQEWRQLTNLNGQGAWSPVWTPDGSAVAFMSNMGNQLNGWLINVDDRSLQQLAVDSPIMPRALSVIP